MKEYFLRSRKNPQDVIILRRYDLTTGQMKEIWRDGYEIIAVR